MKRTIFLMVFLVACVVWGGGEKKKPVLGFVGLHGGVFEQMKRFEKDLNMHFEYITDKEIEEESVDFASFDMIFLQHVRESLRDQYMRLVTSAKKRKPSLRIFDISGGAERRLSRLFKQGLIERDPKIKEYYGGEPENLRRLLVYISVKYFGRTGEIKPPVAVDRRGIYHPDHGRFDSVDKLLEWAKGRGIDVDGPRAVVAVHLTHLLLQQPRVVDAIIREFERRGVFAVAMLDYGAKYERFMLKFKPDVVIHTCHSRERVPFRVELGVPHLHSIFFRKQSIEQWRNNLVEGLDRLSFQVTGQEVIGAIEPQIGAGTLKGGGSEEAFTPIMERIAHLVGRAVSWIRLRRLPNKDKRIAIIYWDREMGKSELMRGSATGMFLNAPRSLVRVLARMKKEGYTLTKVPADEDELIGWMLKWGRQIGVWAPGVLDRLARSGKAALVPVDVYKEWFERKVPPRQRAALVKRWGPPPGRFLVWKNDEGKEFIVIPKIDLGNVILLPQPLRGEAHDTSLVHDRRVPPPHNYLATYFWLQEEFKADALIHFGTHGTDFLLPGRPTGLGPEDWTDMIMGLMPNIQVWVINNLGESSPSRRRSYSVLIDHLTPPSVRAGLSDDLLNLQGDVEKWMTLQPGALREKFRALITEEVKKQHLDKDLHFDLKGGRLLSAEEIRNLSSYLHDLRNETIPVCLHVLGEPPRKDLLVPYLVTCLRKRFLEALGEVIAVPADCSISPQRRKEYLRNKAEEVVSLVVREGLSPREAVSAVGGDVSKGMPKKLQESFALLARLRKGFSLTHQEIDNLMAALSGRFIPPGPGNSPDRNSSVVPTGRNMYVMNPEEVPSKPSWELGKFLVDQLLEQQLKKKGRYPKKVAFTLNSFATFQDYGVMESQILYLIGVRPVWDESNRVIDVEIIPRSELGRPRIDVFISVLGYYRDTLPTRMRLLDKAIRLVASLREKDNFLYADAVRVKRRLEEAGYSPRDAGILSKARIFGGPPGQVGVGAGYYYLVEKSGEWDTREDLMKVYLSHARHVYTKGMWGKDTPVAYNAHIEGSEIVLRTWADRTRSPLSNKYVWYKGGSLCLAIKYLTGKEPEFILSDVRDPDNARMVNAHDALRADYRVRLFNRKWIEGMMKEGYAGADQIAVHVANTMGWKIMREKSVTDDIWQEIVDVYVRDKKNLNIREWFEAENPFAFQEITEILLESIRKGYWQPDASVVREIAVEYVKSVVRHGEGGGLRGGGNVKLERFVEKVLRAPGAERFSALMEKYRARLEEARSAAGKEGASVSGLADKRAKMSATRKVKGRKMEVQEKKVIRPVTGYTLLIFLVVLLLVIAGFWMRSGSPCPPR